MERSACHGDVMMSSLLMHLQTIDAWKKQGFQNNPGYESFAQLLQAPVDDAQVCTRKVLLRASLFVK